MSWPIRAIVTGFYGALAVSLVTNGQWTLAVSLAAGFLVGIVAQILTRRGQ